MHAVCCVLCRCCVLCASLYIGSAAFAIALEFALSSSCSVEVDDGRGALGVRMPPGAILRRRRRLAFPLSTLNSAAKLGDA